MSRLFYLCVLSTILAQLAASMSWKGDDKTDMDIQNILRGLLASEAEDLSNKRVLEVNGFSWSNCGKPDDVIQPSMLDIGPDPIMLPGDINITAAGNLSQTLTGPIELSLKLEKKELFWFPVPCIDDVGSCDYSDICDKLKPITCPPVFQQYHIPCHCPFAAGNYTLPMSSVFVNFKPSHIEKGNYRVTAHIKQSGQELGCVHLQFVLQ